MVLLHNFHYLISTFALTVWTQSPFIIFLIYYIFQTILFFGGITTTPSDQSNLWGYQSIVALIGIASGVVFYCITNMPRLLHFRAAYIGMWGKFLLWLLVFGIAQILYAIYPIQVDPFVLEIPTTGSPWGLIFTMGIHVAIMACLWFSLLWEDVIWKNYEGVNVLFFAWIALLTVMELLFFTSYILTEVYVAMISGGAILLILFIILMLCPATRYQH